ncbi:MAG: chemotaxis protein CheD [Chloroflexota bacterium]
MMVGNPVAVGLGEIRVSRDPRDILVAYGLGSCVGVAAFDPAVNCGALAHVMLPGGKENGGEGRSAKHATAAIPMMLEVLQSMGCSRSRLIWKIAGGAQVLSVPGGCPQLQIGERNVAAVKKVLQELGLMLSGEDTGGRSGRTMQLLIGQRGKVIVRSGGGFEREL